MFICIAGKNNIAVDILEYLLANNDRNYDLGIVCNRNETGVNGWQKSLRYFAQKNDIKEYKLSDVYDIENLIFLSLEFDQIVKPELFKDAELYNIHFSLLPAYKGMYTSSIPILNDEKYVGVTFHKMDRGIDTGDIIKQKKFELGEKTTCRELYLQYIKFGTELVKECLKDVLSGSVHAIPQSAKDSTYYSKSYIDYSNLTIDLCQTARNIQNQIRAFNFREYQLPIVYGKKIIATEITNIKSTQRPGKILFETDKGMMITTIDYNILLYFDRLDELLEACKTGNSNLVYDICTVPEHINAINEKGWSPLIVATYNNQIEIAKFLILKGADIYTTNHNGTTLLMYAKDAFFNHGSIELFKFFKDAGLDIEAKDYFGLTLREYVEKSGHTMQELFNALNEHP